MNVCLLVTLSGTCTPRTTHCTTRYRCYLGTPRDTCHFLFFSLVGFEWTQCIKKCATWRVWAFILFHWFHWYALSSFDTFRAGRWSTSTLWKPSLTGTFTVDFWNFFVWFAKGTGRITVWPCPNKLFTATAIFGHVWSTLWIGVGCPCMLWRGGHGRLPERTHLWITSSKCSKNTTLTVGGGRHRRYTVIIWTCTTTSILRATGDPCKQITNLWMLRKEENKC